jgi:hypothetical protein
MIEKIILKKSSVLDKMPTTEQLEYGEIALNFNTMNPFISFKDTEDGIRQIKDYSNEIQNINGSLTDAKNEINYLRPLVTDNHTNLMFLRGDFEDFKTDNTNEINALRTDIDKDTDAIATKADKTELDTINANVDQKVSKTDIVQNTGQSTTSVMSQKAVSDALSTKVGKTDITQSTGTSETAVMSQNAVSDALSTKADKTELGSYATKENTDTKVAKTDIVQSVGNATDKIMSQKASTDSFIANTPSGDPMHNMYVAMGAVWNGDTGFWEMNGLNDLTNEDMLWIYKMSYVQPLQVDRVEFAPFSYQYNSTNKARTTSTKYYGVGGGVELIMPTFTWNCCIEIIHFNYRNDPYLNFGNSVSLAYCQNLKEIRDTVIIDNSYANMSQDYKLVEVRFILKSNIKFGDSPKLSIASVKYMIENASSSAITITLHPTAYDRAIADTGVQEALANKTNVSLAKAE